MRNRVAVNQIVSITAANRPKRGRGPKTTRTIVVPKKTAKKRKRNAQ
jgi:hypothetical protein